MNSRLFFGEPAGSTHSPRPSLDEMSKDLDVPSEMPSGVPLPDKNLSHHA